MFTADGDQPVVLEPSVRREPPRPAGEELADLRDCGIGAQPLVRRLQHDERIDAFGIRRVGDQPCRKLLLLGMSLQRCGQVGARTCVIDDADAARRDHRTPAQNLPLFDEHLCPYVRHALGLRHRIGLRRRESVVGQPQWQLVHLRVGKVKQRKRHGRIRLRA